MLLCDFINWEPIQFLYYDHWGLQGLRQIPYTSLSQALWHRNNFRAYGNHYLFSIQSEYQW